MKRSVGVLVLSTLLLSGSSFAASREQQEMQRDIAQLQDQVRTLQSGFDQKMAALQTLVQQALDAGNKANTSVSVLTSSVTQTLDRELKDSMRPVAGLSAKVDNMSENMAEVRNSVSDLTAQVNRIVQQLTDVSNAIKVIQVPAAAPPPPSGTSPEAAPGANTGARNVPPAKVQYDNANTDYTSGKLDLAATEFADFIRFYPDDPYAVTAQYFIGQAHYAQQKYEQAAMDFDAVLERYPEGKMTPDASFMKGMALKQAGHRDAAAVEFRALAKKYPRSDQASQATEQLRAMGLSTTAPSAATRKTLKK
jgi:tol-pal system protein YbgF